MTNNERKQIVINAINEYHAAKASGSREKMIHAINGMENVYIAVSLHAVDNAEVLRRLIITAKEEIKNILTPAEIYAVAVATLPPEDIDHHASDLYLKRTPAAVALVDRLENKSLLSVFRDPAGVPWYELPFCFTPYWENPAKYY